jgi:catechol 2,3-dioxygenase-like lactoylglutathione lyase family enzyme
MRLRQVALVARELEPTVDALCDVLGIEVAFNDPDVAVFGLRNAVMPIGDTFLEVVSPKEAGTTAGRLLEKRGGDGGYMAIFQVDDIEKARARVAAQGVRVVDQMDRNGASFTHLHPRDVGGAILSIDAMEPKERWEWGGPHWKENVRTETATGIVGAELQGDDPGAMAAKWASVLGRDRQATDGGWRIPVDGGELRFVAAKDGRGEGLSAFDVAVHDPEAVRAKAKARGLVDASGDITLCGTRVRLVKA